MTPREFKAWFEGFTEAFTGCPTKAQWARIKERVGEIDGNPVTERIYLDRYWHYPYVSATTWTTSGVPTTSTTGVYLANAGYNSITAMNTLGKAEAATV